MLAVEDLRCDYSTGSVLDGLGISVADGEIVALLGRNGMGKTTLVRSIMGMTPPAVTTGSVTYRGNQLVGLPSHEIARLGIGLVPQGRHVFGSLSVSENLTTTARGQQRANAWTLDRVFEFFPRLRERRRQRASTLSGGEQQMLAIGRALMTNPSLLVFDEASEGLAPPIVRELGERLAQLKEGSIALLLVEQNVGLARSLSDRICILGGLGRIVWEGTGAEFDESEAATREHLGV